MGTCGVSKLYCADSREQVSSDPQSSPEIAQFGPICFPGNVEPAKTIAEFKRLEHQNIIGPWPLGRWGPGALIKG